MALKMTFHFQRKDTQTHNSHFINQYHICRVDINCLRLRIMHYPLFQKNKQLRNYFFFTD